jgi:hypothetical protein
VDRFFCPQISQIRRIFLGTRRDRLTDRGHFFCVPSESQAERPRSGGLACISGSQTLQDRKHFAWCSFRFAGGTPASQVRGRLACMRLYSTANERGYISTDFVVCLSAKCRRDARDPLVSPAFQDRRHLACMWLYSTANERGLNRKRLFVCLSAKCRRDACVPSDKLLPTP